MSERDLTKLLYLADAIVRSPSSWQKFFAALAEESFGTLPPQLQKSIDALHAALSRLSAAPLPGGPSEVVRCAAHDLLQQDEPSKEAGRALAWALENVEAVSRRKVSAA